MQFVVQHECIFPCTEHVHVHVCTCIMATVLDFSLHVKYMYTYCIKLIHVRVYLTVNRFQEKLSTVLTTVNRLKMGKASADEQTSRFRVLFCTIFVWGVCVHFFFIGPA